MWGGWEWCALRPEIQKKALGKILTKENPRNHFVVACSTYGHMRRKLTLLWFEMNTVSHCILQ